METKFTPIAMRCNQEQFEAIEPKLQKAEHNFSILGGFHECNYLCNNWHDDKTIANCQESHSRLRKSTVYETWNEETFLRACGIEVEETFTITKEQILQLNNNYDCGVALKEWFPSAFKQELELNKWYKWNENLYKDDILFLHTKEDERLYFYGIFNEKWTNKDWTHKKNNFTLATPQEVETALINEAKRRGFMNGNYKCLRGHTEIVKEIFFYDEKETPYITVKEDYYNDVFKDGKWAEILPQPTEMTLEQRVANLEEIIENLK